jgi:hypothetical protein
MGFPPISTMGLGLISVSSASRVPNPPASMAVFIVKPVCSGNFFEMDNNFWIRARQVAACLRAARSNVKPVL